MSQDRWSAAAEAIATIYEQVDRLEATFPGRHFTPDGHLVGSIGEVLAAYMFNLELLPASEPAHDAVAADGKRVQIKLTQRNRVSLYHEPEHLIALQRGADGHLKTVFNGPGAPAWNAAGKMQKNGQRPISVSRLAQLMEDVSEPQRLPLTRSAPI